MKKTKLKKGDVYMFYDLNKELKIGYVDYLFALKSIKIIQLEHFKIALSFFERNKIELIYIGKL